MRIYTKTGDKGETSLLGGERTSKSDPRVWAYGTIDEAVSALGVARSLIKDENLKETILQIQKKLFQLSAELASISTKVYEKRIKEEDVDELEKIIDNLEELKPKQSAFIIPGDTLESAALDLARTIIRRAERELVKLEQHFEVNEILMKYVNRLSDAVYVMARYIEYVHKK